MHLCPKEKVATEEGKTTGEIDTAVVLGKSIKSQANKPKEKIEIWIQGQMRQARESYILQKIETANCSLQSLRKCLESRNGRIKRKNQNK